MATSGGRSRWTDYLQAHLFWACDITASSVPVMTPLFGFSGISAPKINVDVETFKDGTFNYPRHVVKGASVGPITFTRAASMYDSDFYDWIYYAINGTTESQANLSASSVLGSVLGATTGPVRRDLLVIHFARINLANDGLIGTLEEAAFGALIGGLSGGIAGAGIGAIAGAGIAIAGIGGFGPFQFATWLPARAWILHGCIPTDYTSSTDFDANNANVSLMTLSVLPEFIEEFSASL
jgi:phage tail-like protein